MSYFHKFVKFSKALFTNIAKNYLLLLQQIFDSLKKSASWKQWYAVGLEKLFVFVLITIANTITS